MPSLPRAREGVSPVVAVILLVAITVVLASVVYIMVSNIVIVNPHVAQLSAACQHTGANWTIVITTAAPGITTAGTFFSTRGTNGSFVIFPVPLTNFTGHFVDQDPKGLLNPSDSVTVPYATHPRGSSFTFATGQSVLFEGIFNE
jgi:flagellin-like protein